MVPQSLFTNIFAQNMLMRDELLQHVIIENKIHYTIIINYGEIIILATVQLTK